MSIAALIQSVAAPVLSIIDKSVPDKDQANQLKVQIQQEMMNFDAKVLESQTAAIVAEAKGDSSLQRNWRPITMLTFTGLIVAHWLGFTPENLPESEVAALLDIVKIGLGGYVFGRSAEKVAANWKPNQT
jgi:hypothetical protein